MTEPMTEMEQECRNCRSCRAWAETVAGESEGLCCRRSPVILLNSLHAESNLRGYWPEVDAEDWCAEWIPHPVVQTPLRPGATPLPVIDAASQDVQE